MLFLLRVFLIATCLLSVLVLCVEDYYKGCLLGLGRNASDREIKKAYRSLSKRYHPDKNPNDESAKQKFAAVADAYDALSNAETRKIYDQYGHEGVEKHKQSGGRARGAHDPFDLFSRFFGGGGHFGGGAARGPNMEARVAVPLRDFYSGVDTEFSIEKQQICDACEGSGSADGALESCGHCGGRGILIQKAQLAPGIFQQMQSQCGACGGKGQVIRHPCKTCGGAKVVLAKETHELHVEPGMPRGHRVTYENEAGESPDYEAGDLFVHVLEQEPTMVFADGARHDGTYFRRRGQDLFWREVLSLREAWMGDWTRNLTHLDGHTVNLGRPRGVVVQPGLVESMHGEGMPTWHEEGTDTPGTGDEFGTLHVEYVVIIPDSMEGGMEKEFWSVWDKWRKKKGVKLDADTGRSEAIANAHGEL
ncbi:MAG: DnaJ- protein scj1 [Chrysothrix sp. TS-e1954]|nr:MAG: DnaJ- protein scj1 [Chrysothrix sp. TS-e1954]